MKNSTPQRVNEVQVQVQKSQKLIWMDLDYIYCIIYIMYCISLSYLYPEVDHTLSKKDPNKIHSLDSFSVTYLPFINFYFLQHYLSKVGWIKLILNFL